jgi:glycosyltransferase involved in cell wall biosynthesis
VHVLTVGYTTLAQAQAKGIISDHADALNLWYNPGGRFARSIVYIPFGKANLDLSLTNEILYVERAPHAGRCGATSVVYKTRHWLKVIREGMQLIRSERIDVLKSNGPNLSAVVVLALRHLSHKPAVLFIEAFWESLLPEQNYLSPWIRKWLPTWYRHVYRAFDFYFGTPSIDPDYFVSRGMDRKRILPWVNELDLELLKESAQQVQIPSEVHQLPRPRIVAVGRLHREKCASDALQILDRLRSRGRAASLILVGDGEERASLEQTAERLGLRDRLLITGIVPQALGYSIVLNSDLYFAPMQGNALVEALYAGLPVVAYDHATHRNLIRHGTTGWLVPFRDVNAAVTALERLLNEPELARAMAINARADMQARFGRDTVAEILSRPVFAAYAKIHGAPAQA